MSLRNVFHAYVVRVERNGGDKANGDGWEFVEYRVVMADGIQLVLDTADTDEEVYVVNDFSSRESAMSAILELER